MATRVLTQVNYSAGENARGDSSLYFTAGLLHSMLRLRPDLHFYVLIPTRDEAVWRDALSHKQITAIALELVPRLHGGDFRFDPAELYSKFDFRRFDVDILLLNQPETAAAYIHYFNRQTFHNVPAISYVHWFDTRRPSTPKNGQQAPAILSALTGMLISSATACNSDFGAADILTHAARWFQPAVVEDFAKRLRVLPPGVESARLAHSRVTRPPGSTRLLVNHRLLKYTGVRSLLTDKLPKLWAERQDFEVIVTNPSRVRLPSDIINAPFISVRSLSRSDYFGLLWECDIVLGPHRASHWSMATLEAICAECVPFMNRESFHEEMCAPLLAELSNSERALAERSWFYFRGQFVPKLSDLIDRLDEHRTLAAQIAPLARAQYDWETVGKGWADLFDETEDRIPSMAETTPSMARILRTVQERGQVGKADILSELRWSPKQRALSWTAFRKTLRKYTVEDSSQAEAIYTWM